MMQPGDIALVDAYTTVYTWHPLNGPYETWVERYEGRTHATCAERTVCVLYTDKDIACMVLFENCTTGWVLSERLRGLPNES